MKLTNRLFLVLTLWLSATIFNTLSGQEAIFSITTSPSERTDSEMNFSWATDTTIKSATLEVAPLKDKRWKKAITRTFEGVLCTTYDSIYSKTKSGENFYEDVVINKFDANIDALKSDKDYKYRIIAGGDTTETYYFTTSGAKRWSACVISDFHAYSPLYHRTKAAMDMIGVVEDFEKGFDWILHLGDITAWGGSYSFWQNLYLEEPFINYMWAGVNGNHDNMTRQYGQSNKFFRDAAAYPRNGYEGEEGVCYHFKYGDVLFVMLNNESMRDSAGLAAAQSWVKDVVTNNPSPYVVVCEHYQWFFGANGKDSQYGRWSELFDELGVNLALAGNNHIYMSSYPLYGGKVVDSQSGTTYIQVTSSDNERGSACDLDAPLEYNSEKIKFRWTEGPKTVSALHLNVTPKKMTITLLDRNGSVLDKTEVLPRKR